jgi:ATP-binding cassette subfamily B protein
VLAEGLMLASVLDGSAAAGGGILGALEPFGAVIALAAGLAGVSWVRRAAERRLGRELETRARVNLLERMPRLPDPFVLSRLPGDLAERTHAMTRLRELPEVVVDLFASGVRAVALLVGIAWIFPGAAAPAFGAVLIAGGVPWLGRALLRDASLRTRTLAAGASRALFDALRGAVAVRAHGAGAAVERAHARVADAWRSAGLRELDATVALGLAASGPAFVLAGLAVVVEATERASPAPAALLLLAWWVLQLPEIAADVAGSVAWLERLRAVASRLTDLFGAPLEPPPATAAAPGDGAAGAAIRWRSVTVEAGGSLVLGPVDLEVSPGQRLAIVGPSGAGKSTLLGTLLGWHAPSAGTIEIDGEPASLGPDGRGRVGWLDPSIRVWSSTFSDNCVYGTGRVAPRAADLEDSGLLAVLATLERGSATRLGEGGSRLSGGEAQRVRFARLLGREGPSIVLLDEPFRGIERSERRRLLETALRRFDGVTVLCTMHGLEDADLFDRVVRIEAGRVVDDRAAAGYAASPPEDGLGPAAEWRRLVLAGGGLREVER